jgi:hypothetical protein
MIALSVAQIAEIVGGELADITPAEAAATHVTGTVEFDFVKDAEHAIVLRGVAQEVALNFGGTTPGAGAVLSWQIVWTEETE